MMSEAINGENGTMKSTIAAHTGDSIATATQTNIQAKIAKLVIIRESTRVTDLEYFINTPPKVFGENYIKYKYYCQVRGNRNG